ncbi:allergen Fus c 3 [Podospora australis]|uniref:Allergen Fus c 3 n=1 Tax=Podospora australis TaxID=1536484 RepID=A0AAN6X1F1_9PEZI|nr:allergen Fus c 3 [Podospora australis]
MHLVAGGLNPLGAGDLGRLGPPYQTTNTPSAASSSTSGQADFLYSHTTYPPRVQSREPPNVISSSGQPGFPYSALHSTVTSPVAIADWQQQQPYSTIGQPYSTIGGGISNHGSPALSALSVPGSGPMIGYASQPQSAAEPYMGNYVSPASMQNGQQPNFHHYEYTWPGADDGNMSFGTASPSALVSPISQGFEMIASPTEGGVGEGTGGWQQQEQQQARFPPDTTGAGVSNSKLKRTKRPRIPPVPILANPTPPGQAGVSGSKSKLRSASRTSKNVQVRTDETTKERKTRNSHNLVEKQYRNRLNAQFEALMNTLPESMRSPTGTSMSGGDSEGLDAGEKRLSKAQVLDMSTRYIRSLEGDRDRLQDENGELRENMAKTREMCFGPGAAASGLGGGGGGGQGGGNRHQGPGGPPTG